MSSVTIIKDRRDLKILSFDTNFFTNGEKYIVKVNDEKIVITRPTIDYQGKSYIARLKSTGTRMLIHVTYDMPTGVFDVEESEDELIVYF
jgi:hypothetical protein